MDPFLFNQNMTETSLQNLMKEIGDAVKLDDENHDKGAYIKYTSCIFRIASNLLLGIKGSQCDLQMSPSISRQVKLLQHCVDRVESLVEKLEKCGTESPKQPATTATDLRMQQGPNYANNEGAGGQAHTTPFTSSQSPVHQVSSMSPTIGQNKDETILKPPSIHMNVPSLPPENNPHVFNKAHKVTPLEKAHAQNRSLIIAYKARMERLNKSNFNAYSYSLTLQRKMTENLEIAKAQEEELAKKMKARQERLEEAAARRFAHPTGMSDEERELKQIYKNILTYENDVEWLSVWRQKLAASQEDPIIICQLVQEILRCSDHPFTEMLRAFQFKIYQQLYPLVVNRHSEIDLIKVDLPHHMWPSAEEVADILFAHTRKPSTSAPEVRRRRRIHSRGRTSESKVESDTDNADQRKGPEILGNEESRDVKDPMESIASAEKSSQVMDESSEKVADKQSDLNENDQRCSTSEDQSDADRHTDTDVITVDDSEMVEDCIEKMNSSISEDVRAASDDDVEVKSNKVTDLSITHEETSSEEENDLKSDLESAATSTQEQLRLAYVKGRQLESELGVQRQQARMLMQQISQGNNLDEEDFDDLFDDDDDYDDEDNDKKNDDNYNSSQHNSGDTHTEPGKTMSDHVIELTDGNRIHRSNSSSHVLRYSSEGQPDEMYTSLPPMPYLPDSKVKSSDNMNEELNVSKMKLEALERHLKTICKEIHCQLDKLLRVMVVAYEMLDSPVGKDQCAVALEEPFFKPIWKTLLRLFRVVNHRKEIVLACVMTTHKGASPETMKVRPKFQLSSPSSQEIPYQEAIEELLRLPRYYTIPCKMECLVRVCRLICECVDKFYTSQQLVSDENQDVKKKEPPALGADDLVPVLTYVILHSQCPQLISECQAIAEFIAEGYMMGEEGYCLTTFRTAVEFLISLYTPVEAGDNTVTGT